MNRPGQTLTAPKSDARAKAVTRPCLCCGAAFRSEGAHNRLCHDCRRRNDPAPDMGLAVPSRRGGKP
jgi:hypothetical protein